MDGGLERLFLKVTAAEGSPHHPLKVKTTTSTTTQKRQIGGICPLANFPSLGP
jgi:hypothetical protein